MDFDNGIVHTLLRLGILELPQLDLDSLRQAPSDGNESKRKMAMYLVSNRFREPIPKYQEFRRNGVWEEHVTKCLHKRDEFQRRYHMSIDAFQTLVGYLDIKLDHKQSQCSSGGIEAIDANIIVACGLRWLGGESHKTNADAFHISIASSKRVVTQFINAINECNLLSINLPTEDELEELAIRTMEKSTCDDSFYGCVLMIDGFLSTRTTPGNHECTAVTDFYSGHKKTYGLNVQALCDHTLRFRYVCVAAPGKTNDNKAFYRCTGLQTWLQTLPTQYFIVCDNAYPLSNKLLTPFKGRQREDVYNSSYNFYLSQLRIRIEMAFGRMTAKFRIMRHQMICTLAMQSKVIGAVTRLHNFVIDANGEDVGADQPVRIGPNDSLEENELGRLGIEPLAADVEGNLGFVAVPYETDEVVSSARQRDIVEQLRQKTIQRPVYNLQRNNN